LHFRIPNIAGFIGLKLISYICFNLIPSKMKSRKIVVIGSSNTDMVIKADRLPAPGETIIGGTFLMNPGGKGGNQAVAAARMGGNVSFISKTGNDVFGKQSKELYRSEGINSDYIFTDPTNPSGVALITVDEAGENCIVVASGANASLSAQDMESAKTEIETAGLVLLQLEIPIETVEYAAEMAHNKGIPVILNPAPARVLSAKMLKMLYMITPNETEAEMLTGIKVSDREQAKKAADVISAMGVKIVVITMGSQGAFIKENNAYHFVEATPVKAMDTTAAGDCFTGSLCVGLSEGLSVVDAVKMAGKAAAISVTRMGAQGSMPFRKELKNA
jgi:ribokinase